MAYDSREEFKVAVGGEIKEARVDREASVKASADILGVSVDVAGAAQDIVDNTLGKLFG